MSLLLSSKPEAQGSAGRVHDPVLKTFLHSGDLGDLIYGLPTIRALGGGILYIDPLHRRESIIHMLPESIDLLAPLLMRQPYIKDVIAWNGETPVDYDLDQWRKQKDTLTTPIADNHLKVFGLPSAERDVAWITIDKPIHTKKYVIGRSRRHLSGPPHPWPETYRTFLSEGVFIGLPKDHRAFVRDVGKIEYYRVDNFLTTTRVIAGCDLFIGNQAFPYAIAEGLKHNSILEVSWLTPNCNYDRANAKYF